MKKEKFFQLAEVALSLLIVVGIYWLGENLKLPEKTIPVTPSIIEGRDEFYAGVIVGEKVRWVVGKKGKILRSESNGAGWNPQNSGVKTALQGIAAWDEKKAVVVGNDGLVLLTHDSGNTWEKVQLGNEGLGVKLLKVRIDPEGVAWAVGAMGAVYASHDTGKSWRRMARTQDIAWNDVGFSPDGKVWLVGEFGHVAFADPKHVDDNGELEWQAVKVSADRSLMAIIFLDAQTALIAGLDGTLLRTKDSGKSWEKVLLPTREHIFALASNGHTTVGVGSRGLRIVSQQGGSSWEVGRVAKEDFNWHTDIAIKGEEQLIVGAGLVQMNGRE